MATQKDEKQIANTLYKVVENTLLTLVCVEFGYTLVKTIVGLRSYMYKSNRVELVVQQQPSDQIPKTKERN